MKRREFIALLGGAAAAWPLAVCAQTGKLVRLGYLDGGARADPTVQNLHRQFALGMRDLGYNEGRDYRWRSVRCRAIRQLPVLCARTG